MAAHQDGNLSSEASSINQPVKTTPKEALVMASILKEMGVNEYEPRVVNQMIEFAYRYVTDIVEDARVYSQHANRKNMNVDDVKLAVSQKLDHSFTSPPPREFLLEIARSKNSLPLPLITDRSGLRLPPERYCLTGNNYKVKGLPKKSQSQQGRKQSQGASGKKASATATATLSKAQASPAMTPQTIQSPVVPQNVPGTFPPPASIESKGFPNLLKRKHEGDDDYDT